MKGRREALRALNWVQVVLLGCVSASSSVMFGVASVTLVWAGADQQAVVWAAAGGVLHGMSLLLARASTRDATEVHCVRAGVALVPSAVVAAAASVLLAVGVSIRGVDHRVLLGGVVVWVAFLGAVAVVVSACRERFVPHRAGAHRVAGLGWPAIALSGVGLTAVLTLLVLPR